MTDANESIQIVVKKTYTISKEKAKSIPLLKNLIEDDMYENKTLELPRGYDVLEHVLNGKELIVEDDKRLEELKQEFSYFGLETDKLVDDYNKKVSLITKLKKISKTHSRLHKHLEKSSLDDIELMYKLMELIRIKTPRKRTNSAKKKNWNAIQPRN